MLKILNYHQLKEWDAFTIENEPISSINLMERACSAIVNILTRQLSKSIKVGVVCGTGNNGGDGLGIARLLSDLGYQVKIWIVRGGASATPEFEANLGRLSQPVVEIFSVQTADMFLEVDILIDAIFGIGLNRPLEGIYSQVVELINSSPAKVIAIEIPSGLMIDRHSSGKIVMADYTYTIQIPKLSFFFPENGKYLGKWECVDIGLSESFVESADSFYFWTTKDDVKGLIKSYSTFDHKGSHGKALMIAGSYGKMGACILATRAALRSGIGLITVNAPKSGYHILQVSVPEAMVVMDVEDKVWSANPLIDFDLIDAVGIGPGLGLDPITCEAFLKILKSGKPLVIDADGLNIMSEHPDWLDLIPNGSILSPHAGEFERLTGRWKDDFERLDFQINLAKKVKAVIILKGAYTSIATPTGKVFFNSSGNPGMATGGSGDVLTGILTALLAAGYSSINAALIGVYLHGLAGDLALKEKGHHSLIASDIIEYLPKAFLDVSKKHLSN